MARVDRFEDLIAWQKARELTRGVYQATKVRTFARDFGLSRQIQRAAVSIMGNIAEGFERHRDGEFHQYLSTAKASCGEVRSHLYAALAAGHLDQIVFDNLKSLAEEVGQINGGLRCAVEKRKSNP